MGKNDYLTPKAIANRIKAKGLQKLRWYCQMCQKQCRDENGFKCHCLSESHQRQMQVFGDNPNRFVNGFSEEFERSFLEHVKRSHRFSRVAATVLYNEYISDRHHIHMNSTEWATLTDFVKHLGRAGKCKVEETEKGWFVTYIDREPETLMRESMKKKREKSEIADEERHEKEVLQQIARASKAARTSETAVDAEDPSIEEKKVFKRTGEEEKITFGFNLGKSKPDDKNKSKTINKDDESTGKGFVDMGESEGKSRGNFSRDREVKDNSKGGMAIHDLMAEEEKKKEKINRKDYWLTEGVIVKVMSKSLAEHGFYKQKGLVKNVIGKYVGEIKMLDGGAVLKVDQEELETVIPQIGGMVKIVNGAYRGSLARLLSIDTSRFSAKVQIEKGIYDGRVLNAIDYEDICKYSPSG